MLKFSYRQAGYATGDREEHFSTSLCKTLTLELWRILCEWFSWSQLGFDAFSIYNNAPNTLRIIGALPPIMALLNIHPWRNDARSHYQ